MFVIGMTACFMPYKNYRKIRGLLYKEGKIPEARKWWTLAANQEEVDAQVSLGTLFEEEGNIAEAKKLYQKAKEQGGYC